MTEVGTYVFISFRMMSGDRCFCLKKGSIKGFMKRISKKGSEKEIKSNEVMT